MRKSCRSALLLFAIIAMSWSAPPATAQCNPSFDPDCLGPGNGTGPDVGFSPDAGTYTTDGTTKQIALTISFSDADGLDQSTLQLRLMNNGTTTNPLSAFTWKANTSGTGATLTGQLSLAPGESLLTAQIADRQANVGAGQAVFQVSSYANTANPVALLDPHHNDYRDTTQGTMALTYALPPTTSLDTQRTVGLFYSSEHANPTGFVQVDARPSVRSAAQTQVMSIHITDVNNQTLFRPYFFTKGQTNTQRLAAEWSMKDSPTGAYVYNLMVRGLSTGGYDQTGVRVRTLVVNERNSRYGAGWSLALPRLYSVDSAALRGMLLTEGNGVARFFLLAGCTAAGCSYTTPEGDFTKLFFDYGTFKITRTAIDGSTQTFDARGLLISGADAFGRSTKYTWQDSADPAHVPVLGKVTDYVGKVTLLEYYPSGYLKQIVDPAGRKAVFTYSGNFLTGITGPESLSIAYDAAGRVTSYVTQGATWDVTYDQRGVGWDTVSERPTVATVTGPAVTVNGASVRPVARSQSLQAGTLLGDNAGRTFETAAPAMPSDSTFVQSTDPENHVTYMSVDRYGNPTKIVDGAGRISTATWNSDGLPLSSVDVDDQTTTSSWNSRGQLLLSSVNGSTVYEASYKIHASPEYEYVNGNGRWYAYGSRGEVVRSWTGAKSDESRTATTYEYDYHYLLTRTTGPKGEKVERAYGANEWANLEYVRTVRPDGSTATSSFTYDEAGRTRTVTDPLGQTTTTEYDTLNRTRRVTDSAGRAVVYTYTGANLTGVTDRAGKMFQFSHDAMGRVLTETFPDGKRRLYAYNGDGLPTSHTDRRGATMTMAWDGAHRMTDRTADGATTTFRYPDRYTTVVQNAEGSETVRLLAGLGTLGSVSTTFGALPGRRYDVTNVLDPENGWRKKGMDVSRYTNGVHVKTDTIRVTPNYRPLDMTYRSELFVQDLSGYTSTLYFDVAGQHVRTTFPNGVSQNNGYTSDGRLDSMSFTNANVSQTFGATFGYDILNRLVSRTSIAGDALRSYTYDGAGQLSSYERASRGTPPGCNPSYETCEPTWLTTLFAPYTYDAAGNRTDSGARVESGSNRYVSFDGHSLSYDAEGNLTRRYKAGVIDQTYSWNAMGQLAAVTTNGSVVTYGYNGFGERVRRTEGGQARYFLYDGDDLLMELDASGNPFRSYTHLPGIDRPLSLRVTNGATETAYYYVTEQPGHVSGLMNLSGGINAIYRYTPWGVAESTTGAASSQPLRFMARELDANGLYYVRNRWYDPLQARFLSEDPIGLDGGINTYAYLGNDPVNDRDPSGLEAGCIPPRVCLETVFVTCNAGRYDPDCDGPMWEGSSYWWYRHWKEMLDPASPHMAPPAVKAQRARVQERAAETLRRNEIQQCRDRVFESEKAILGTVASVFGLGHTGIGVWNNSHRPPILAADASAAAKARADAMARRQINGDASRRFYGPVLAFTGGSLVGSGMALGLCEYSEDYRAAP